MTILRRWSGAVRAKDVDRYLGHQANTGIAEYRGSDGNLGAVVLRREREDGLIDVATLSLWESLDAVRGFAGDDYTRATFYPGDDAMLAEKDLHADHWEVVSADIDAALLE